MPETFLSNLPLRGDTKRQILAKLLNFWVGGGSGGVYLGSVANYVALRALVSHANLHVVSVLGALAAGDGGGGVFWYDATEAGADDNGTIIIPNDVTRPDPGAWVKLI